MWRTFDVDTVVELLVADHARVVAGSAGMGRTVRRAQVITSVAPMRRVRANDLVVVTAETLLGTGEGTKS